MKLAFDFILNLNLTLVDLKFIKKKLVQSDDFTFLEILKRDRYFVILLIFN